MSEVIVTDTDETPAPDTDVVVAPTIVVTTPDPVPEPVAEVIEEVAEDVIEETVDLAVRVGALEERVVQLEVANIVADDPAPAGDVTIVETEDNAEVVVDNTPESVPWTHKNLFKRGH